MKKEPTWETKNGDEIPYSKLEDGHLLNILRWVEAKANGGMYIRDGGGGPDMEDMWFEEEEITGDDVLERFDYAGLKQEATKRNLKP